MKIIRDDLVKEILKMHFEMGKSITEIARVLSVKYEGWQAYNKEINLGKGKAVNEEYLYLLSQKTIALAKKNLSASELEQINKNKEEIQLQEEQALKLEIAENVRKLYLDLAGLENSEKSFNSAIEAVARRTGLKTETVKNYTVEVFPYLYIQRENLETPEYFIDFAERIIKNDTYLAIAKSVPGYLKMREYIEANRPDLHEKIEAQSAKHMESSRSYFQNLPINTENDIFKGDIKELLAQIMLHFRVSVDVIVDFVNNHADLFLKNTDKINADNLTRLRGALPAMMLYAFNFLYAEDMKEFEDYRIAKFNYFVAQLDLLSSDREKQKRFIESETGDKIASVLEKTKKHELREKYEFTQEEIRNIIKFIYKYGLTRNQASEYFEIPGLSKKEIVSQLVDTDSPDDQILIKGMNLLSEFNQEYLGAPKRQ